MKGSACISARKYGCLHESFSSAKSMKLENNKLYQRPSMKASLMKQSANERGTKAAAFWPQRRIDNEDADSLNDYHACAASILSQISMARSASGWPRLQRWRSAMAGGTQRLSYKLWAACHHQPSSGVNELSKYVKAENNQ